MVLAATYLLWMFQRVALGTMSDFLRGLGDHLTDLTRVEAITLAPLVFLIVVLGIFPSVALDLLSGSVRGFLAAAGVPVG
jgi:NADH-quinone oxidoreductase subunit M